MLADHKGAARRHSPAGARAAVGRPDGHRCRPDGPVALRSGRACCDRLKDSGQCQSRRSQTSLTRRRFMLRSAQVGGGVAAGGLAGLPAPAARARIGAEHRALDAARPSAARRSTDADYWRFADWLAALLRRAVGAREAPLRIGQQRRRPHLPQLAAAHDARGRRADRPRRRRAATTSAPACSRGACATRRPGASATHPPSADPQFHNPGWVESLGTRDAAMDKSIDPKVAEALMYAWRARDVLGLPQETVDLIARPDQPLRARPVLPLPERAPQPDQLELRALRAHRHGHRRHRAARERLPGAGGALLRGHPAAR